MFGTCRFKPFIASLNLPTKAFQLAFSGGRPTPARAGGKVEELLQVRRRCRLLAGPHIEVTELPGPPILVSEGFLCAMKVREVHALGQGVARGRTKKPLPQPAAPERRRLQGSGTRPRSQPLERNRGAPATREIDHS